MKASITNTLLRHLPEDQNTDIYDIRLTGFVLRVRASGKHTYRAVYGRGKAMTLGSADVMTPTQARDRAKEILRDAASGIDPMAAKKAAKAHTLGSFVQEVYAPWAVAHLKTGAAIVARLNACFSEELGDKKLVDVTGWLVEKWRAERLKSGTAPATVNRDIGALKACLARAVDWGHLETHPLTRVKLTKVDSKGVVRFLGEDEEQRLRAAMDAREERIRVERDSANRWRRDRGYTLLRTLRDDAYVDHLMPMVLVSMNTGMRRGEVFGLMWEDVALGRAMLAVRGATAKSGSTRHIPLNVEAVAALKGWKAQHRTEERDLTGLVFPGRDGERLGNVRKSWAGVLKEAKITGFRWHDLRHHFASRLVQAGVDLNTVRELLGHSDIKMTLRYSHLAPEHRAAAVAKLARL